MSSKLYFRYGTVKSAKSLNLLAVAHYYNSQNKKCLVVKPSIENRFGENHVGSRAGLKVKADIIIQKGELMDTALISKEIECILVDEVQFLSQEQINQFKLISIEYDIPIICYGLRTDFSTTLFPGSKRMMEIADQIEEVKSVCMLCRKKAIFSALYENGEFQADLVGTNGNIEICEDKFKPLCSRCFYVKAKESAVLDRLFLHKELNLKV